jgi:hypothetical protein
VSAWSRDAVPEATDRGLDGVLECLLPGGSARDLRRVAPARCTNKAFCSLSIAQMLRSALDLIDIGDEMTTGKRNGYG